MRYQYILFDLDGTLTDSGEGIMNSARYAFVKLGLEVPDDQKLRKMIGPPLSKSFPMLGVPKEQVEEAIGLYRDQYNNRGGKYQNRVYPGIEETLRKLTNAGCVLYVATSKPEILAQDILAKFGLDKYFAYIAGATLDRSRESKGDVLRYLRNIIPEKKETVMVGDTHYDVAGAHEMGLPCAGVTWGYETAEELTDAGADEIIDSPEMLFAYLTKDN